MSFNAHYVIMSMSFMFVFLFFLVYIHVLIQSYDCNNTWLTYLLTYIDTAPWK